MDATGLIDQWTANLPIVPQIQVTRNCNLGCDYCFQEHSGPIIEFSTVQSILHQVVTHNLSVDPGNRCMQIYWHGGEPLLAGIDFFEKILHFEKHYPDLSFENRIQTNGTLMNDKLARFFIDNHFHLGFSLDGPRNIHDRHRRFRLSGDGTFAAAMAGIDCYRRHTGQGRIAVIAVITPAAINQAEAIFKFFKKLKANVQLDIYDMRVQDMIQQGQGPFRFDELRPSAEEIGQFFIDLFDLWFYDQDDQVDFKELRQELKMVLQPEIDRGDPIDKKRCDFRRLIFAPDGLVFSCDQWLNDEKTALGNIRLDSLPSILQRKALLWQKIKTVVRKSGETMACATCAWGRQCGGGCLTCMKYNTLLFQARTNGLPDSQWSKEQLPANLATITGETYYCDGLRSFRRHIQKAVQLEMADAKR